MNFFYQSFVLFLLLCTFPITAQNNNYILSQDSSVYAPLVNPVKVSKQGKFLNKQLTIKLPFNFRYGGIIVNSLDIEDSGVISMKKNNDVRLLTYHYVSDEAMVATDHLLPEINTLYEENKGSGIFKIEFKYSCAGTLAARCFNYQIWLYETSNEIAFHLNPDTYGFIISDPLHPQKVFPPFPEAFGKKLNATMDDQVKKAHVSFPTRMMLSSGNNDLSYIKKAGTSAVVYTFTPMF